jgi:hypothetical protein
MRPDFWRNLELCWAFKDEGSVGKQNRNTDGTKGECFAIIPIRMACGSRIEELELQSFLNGERQSARRDWVKEVWRPGRSSRKGALLNWHGGLESWFIENLNSKMDAEKDEDWNLDSSEISSNTSMVPRICTIWRHGSRRLSSWWWLDGWLGSRRWLELGWLEDQD